MAEKDNNSNVNNIVTNTFTKNLIKDPNESFIGEGSYTHARNAVNNSHDGQQGVIGNEPSNILCVTLPYDLIGAIPLIDNQWAIFTTDDTNSEIGIFDEGRCLYTKVVNDKCLGFKKTNLITGAFRESFNCGRRVYWDDGLNPSRVIDIDNPPYVQSRTKNGDCYIDTNTSVLDCEKLRLAPLITIPCVTLNKGKSAGTLLNGSYQIVIAYTVSEIKVTDYLVVSEVQSLFSHDNASGSLEIHISNTDTEDFDEMEVSIISTVNAQTVVKRLGIYSTSQSTIYIDTIDPTLPVIPLNLIPIRTPAIEKSDSMYNVNNYLLRLGIYSKGDINYQPQANNIVTKWVSVQYPADYYIKGGNNAAYMSDEQYPFFIRWVYNTGDKTVSAHLPGRAPTSDDLAFVTGSDVIEDIAPKKWQVYNTAKLSSIDNYTLPDGGVVIAEGTMGYWESTEIYPDDKPEIWGDLCGKNIRHHKFPDSSIDPTTNHFGNNGKTINVLAVKFENITHPLDINGNPIESIVGYEILRGSREGQKTIIAKGLINNMREYTITGNSTQKGLYQNYPYNDLRPDSFLTNDRQNGTNGSTNASSNLLSGYRKDIFSFHGPDTNFSKPFLSANELKIYSEFNGTTNGQFETPYKHPKFKLTTNADDVIGDIVGVLSALKIFTNGVTIGSTEDYPIGMQIGPLPPFPMRDSDFYVGGVVDGGSTHTDLATEVAYYANLALWASTAISLVATMGKFAELEKEKFFSLMRTLIPRVQYAAQYNSHGFYDSIKSVSLGNTRKKILKSNYLSDNIQTFDTQYQVNNLYRSSGVILSVDTDINDPSTKDESRKTISDANTKVYTNFSTPISSYYTGLKVTLEAQYGQIDSIKQIPISNCITPTVPVKDQLFKSDIYFGGDTYINRFTEKNSFFYFYNWLFDQPDEFEYDYTLYNNIPYPRFWINNAQYLRSILKVSSNFRVLDARQSSLFYVSQGYFYLFNSGVRDFFVESEVNLAYRDWEDPIPKRFYDPFGYTNITDMFRSDIIKSGNFYKYDYSLSNSKLFNSYINWGEVVARDYNPLTAATCYSYYPKRIMYSLPQDLELKKDNWKNFLPNNYKDFPSSITSIKSINKSGALIMLKNDSPVQFMGVDQLQTDGGIKVTIGDGGLFNQALQSITNAESSYEYGACQNKFSVTATTYGVFYISQQSGKIFNFSGGLEEISAYGNKWWFSQYLPSQLLKQFPDFTDYDNPVIGIGCQTIYDSTNDITFFTKKDYKATDPRLVYIPGTGFGIPGGTTTVIDQPAYTEVTKLAYTEIVKPAYDETVSGGDDCTAPIDLYFLLDVTSSMGLTLDNLKTSISNIATALATKSGNNYRLGLLTVNEYKSSGILTNDNIVVVPLNELNNITNFQSHLAPVHLGDGVNIPEPMDVGLASILNNTAVKGITPGTFRSDVIKMIILITDADPSGDDDTYTPGVDNVRAANLAIQAGTQGINIFSITVGAGATDGGIKYIMNRYAVLSGGKYYVSTTGIVDDSILDAIDSVPCPSTIVHHDAVIVNHPAETVTHPATYKTVAVLQPVTLGDPNYFEDASWTISYDPKTKSWLSYHDWHPTFVLPGKRYFMSVLNNSIWAHNNICNSYCNFYGVDYPFEVEFSTSTGQNINTIRSIEYILENYSYGDNCADKYQLLDYNFDRAIVYNNEQISGVLKLNIKEKNNPLSGLNYPIVGGNGIDILYSKEENKYRFNQFYDITKNRGEFNYNPVNMFITKANGYTFQINPAYIDYSKSALEHKKFRNYSNRIFLRKLVSGNTKMLFKLSNVKLLASPR